MSWERQKPFTIERPESPSSTGWLLSGVLSVIAGVLLFVLHASGTISVLNLVNIWLFSLIPVVLWLIIFSIRGYLYGRDLEHFQFLQNEAQHAQQQWSAWAERYLAVMASCVLLPDQVSAALLQKHAKELTQQRGRARRISYLTSEKPTFESAISALLSGVERGVQSLPPDLPVQVTLLTDEPEYRRQELYRQLNDCWREQFPTLPGPSALTVTDELSFNTLDERLKQPESTVQLFLVIQLQGNERFSDGLAALLFTTDDVANKYSLPHRIRLLRPMRLDINTLAKDLELFLTTQALALQTTGILGDQQKWTESSAELIGTGNKQGTAWQAENIQTIETYCGIQGPYSPWLTAALGADFVRLGKQPWLALSTSENEHFICTITIGSGDEPAK